MSRSALAITLVAALATPVAAQEISDAWVRGTVKGQDATGAFMTIKAGTAMALVGAASPVARVVEVHEMSMDGNVMRMRAIPKIDLTAGRILELKPGGYHIMMIGLKGELATGTKVPVTLRFREASGAEKTVEVQAEVRGLTQGAPKPMSGHEHKH